MEVTNVQAAQVCGPQLPMRKRVYIMLVICNIVFGSFFYLQTDVINERPPIGYKSERERTEKIKQSKMKPLALRQESP